MPAGTPKTCEELLRAMVGFESVNGNATGRPFPEKLLAEYLEATASALGFRAARLPIDAHSHNVLVTHEAGAAKPWLLFESHMDTVTLEGMVVEPLKGEVRDGKMFGRGSCDTKGTGAAMIWALRQYAAQQNQPHNIAIVYTTDEEMFKTGVRTFAEKQLPKLGWRPAGAICGEPTLLQPIVAHAGMVRWKIHTRGVAAHSSNPSRGKSAISAMAKVIDAVESGYITGLTATHPLIGKAACSINIIRGGVQINVIPDSCVIDLDRRTMPNEDLDGVVSAVEKVLDDLRRRHPDLEVAQDNAYADPAFDASGNTSFINWVGGVLRGMKLSEEVGGAPYGTDACLLADAGIPTVIIGPGDMGKAHTKDEFIPLSDLERGVELYLRLMQTPMPSMP